MYLLSRLRGICSVESLRILVADDEPLIALSLTAMLKKVGHKVVACVHSGHEAVEQTKVLCPDLILMEIKMGDLDGIEATRRILAHNPVPVVTMTGQSHLELIEKAEAAGVSGFLVKPITEDDLISAILLARSRFKQLQALTQEVMTLKETIKNQKLIAQAKGIIMQKERLTEAEAYQLIQRQSRNDNIPMAKLAEAIITADKLLNPKKPERNSPAH